MSRKVKLLTGTLIVVTAAVAGIVVLTSGQGSTAGSSRFGVATARAAEPIGHIGSGKAAEAIEKAGNAGKYAFAVFYRENDGPTSAARNMVAGACKKIKRKSEIVEINIADSTELDVVKKFGTARAPMPLILVLAPNGAIMGGFPAAQADENKLIDAVGSPASEQVVKAIQQKSMVLLCVQNKKTTDNKAALSGVKEFVKDPKFAENTAVVTVDPSDQDEVKFLSRLNIDVNSTVATTTLLAPPGNIVGSFKGATQKDQLVNAVQAAAKGGCGPGGCGGKPCGPTPTKGK